MTIKCERCGEILDAPPDGCRDPRCPVDDDMLDADCVDCWQQAHDAGLRFYGLDWVTPASLRARGDVPGVWVAAQEDDR